MNQTRHTLNELLVWLFNYILYIEEKNLKASGVHLMCVLFGSCFYPPN